MEIFRQDKYEYIKLAGVQRLNLTEIQRDWIIARLAEWQAMNGYGPERVPFHKDWYWVLRCMGIEEGVITTQSNWDICRTTIRAHLKKLEERTDAVD